MQVRQLSFLVAAVLFAGLASAQQAGTTAEKKADAKPKTEVALNKKAPTPAPTGKAASSPTAKTDGSKKPNFIQRMFGQKEKKPEATPAATPAANSTPRPRRPRRDSTEETPKAEPEKEKEKEKAPEKTPEPETEKAPPTPKATPTPPEKTSRKGKGKAAAPAATPDAQPKTKEQAALDKAVESGDKDAIEKAKYDEVKSRASTDEKIQAIKSKAELAATDEEGRKELKNYNKALFQKMRSLEPSLKGRIDSMEAAVLKQLDGN